MKNLSKLKSRDGKIRRFVGSIPLHPTRTLRLRCSFSGNRSTFILNPRLATP